jgi:hypothetical protein
MILQWLRVIKPPFPFEEKQQEMYQISRNTPGAGTWLLNLPQFIDWRDGESRKLWCYGIREKIFLNFHSITETNAFAAGAGKTVLAYDQPLFVLA